MALPQLYRNLTLTSYDKIRYRGDQPEGMGSASPFSMGLNAVITRPYASLVRSLTLRGDWREHDLEEHARVGRVPDSSMMLNIAVRAAIDRMPELETFNWELSTKMLETVYLGLAQLPKLTSLTVRFPSSRHPRPTTVIPPMPRLRCLKVTDIDPLCYPDDISTLLHKSRKLRDLKLHWSPRMRNEQEPSVNLTTYFRKCIAAKQPLAVRKISLQNLYALHNDDFSLAFDPRTVEHVTILNNTGADGLNFMNTFVDSTWPTNPPGNNPLKIKSMRLDALSKRHCDFLGNFTGLQSLYFVSARGDANDFLNSPRYPTGLTPTAPTSPTTDNNPFLSNGLYTNSPADSPAGDHSLQISLRDSYLNNIITNHAPALRHLLLPSRWAIPASLLARLVHTCPNLEQLALATELPSMETLRLLLPCLRKLMAVRLLIPTGSATPSGQTALRSAKHSPNSQAGSPQCIEKSVASVRSLADIVDLDDQFLTDRMSDCLADKQIFGHLKIIGMGRKAWELRGFYTAPAPPPPPTHPEGTNGTTTPGINNSAENSTRDATPALGTSIPQQPSSLGKRRREDETPIPHPELPVPQISDSCGQCVPAADGKIWRRSLRRVGWDVLQHWSIWALDTQEL